MQNQTEHIGGLDRTRNRAAMLVALVMAMAASLFALPQLTSDAGAVTPEVVTGELQSLITSGGDVAIVTLSAPETCENPQWDFVNYRNNAHVADPDARTTVGYVFEPGHHFFRVKCDGTGDVKYRYGVTGPTTNVDDRIAEMRWTHRAAKCRDCSVTMYHPDYVAADLPGPGYVDPVSWDEWLIKAAESGIDSDVDLELLTKLVERGLVGAAAIIEEPTPPGSPRIFRVSISHIGA